jgi:hypothetical protein
LGGKWEEVKNVFLPHSIGLQAKETSPSPSIGLQAKETSPFPSIGHQTMGHSIGLQAKETYPTLSIGQQALDLPSPPFSFSLKGGLGSWEALSFSGHNFQFSLEYLF